MIDKVVADIAPLPSSASHADVVAWIQKLHVQNRTREKQAVGDVRNKYVSLGQLEALGLLSIGQGNKITLIAAEADIGGFVITAHRIASVNYVAGVSGLALNDDGSAEFNDATLRGEIDAASGTIGGFDITAHRIASTGYVAGVSGLALNDDGTAEFGAASIRGTLTTGQIGANAVTNMDGADAGVQTFMTNGDETIVSLSFTTTGEKLRIDFITGYDFTYTPGGTVTSTPTVVSLVRSGLGSPLYSVSRSPDIPAFTTASDDRQVAFTVIDTPPAGTYTYEVHIDFPYPTANHAHESVVIVAEFKR